MLQSTCALQSVQYSPVHQYSPGAALAQTVVPFVRWDAEHEDLLIRKRVAIQRWRGERAQREADARECVEAGSVREAQAERRACAVSTLQVAATIVCFAKKVRRRGLGEER